MSGAAFHNGKSRQDFATPENFREAVRKRFGPIAWDLAADSGNQFTDHPGHFFDETHNSLIHAWHEIPGTLWLNCPYSNIEPWAWKCAEEAAKGARILFLTPASVGSVWFATHVHRKALVLALSPRLCFDGKSPYPKDCVLSCYNFGVGFDVWQWR